MDGVFFVKGTTIEETLKHRDILDDERFVVDYAIEQRSRASSSYTEDIIFSIFDCVVCRQLWRGKYLHIVPRGEDAESITYINIELYRCDGSSQKVVHES